MPTAKKTVTVRTVVSDTLFEEVCRYADSVGFSISAAAAALIHRAIHQHDGMTWFDQGIPPARFQVPMGAPRGWHEVDPRDLPKGIGSPDVGKDIEPATIHGDVAAAEDGLGEVANDAITQKQAAEKKTRRRRARGTDTPEAGADFLEDPVWHREPENDDEILVRFRYHWEESVEAHKDLPGAIRKMTVVPVKDSSVRRNTLRADHLANQIPITWPVEARERGVWLRLAINEFVRDPFSRGIGRPNDDKKFNADKVYGYDTFVRHADKWLDVAVTNHPDMTVRTEDD